MRAGLLAKGPDHDRRDRPVPPCRQLLEGPVKPVAVLGCSYPAFFHDIRSGQLVNSLRHLGFAEVHEGTSGVDLLIESYRRAIESGGRQP
jgi:hypothetical protein